MQQSRVLLCLLYWLAATSCCAAAKEQRRLDDGGVPLDVGYREHGDYPSPRCCMGGSCAAPRTGQHAFVTSVRTAKYVPLLRQLVCSLAESNPGKPSAAVYPARCLDSPAQSAASCTFLPSPALLLLLTAAQYLTQARVLAGDGWCGRSSKRSLTSAARITTEPRPSPVNQSVASCSLMLVSCSLMCGTSTRKLCLQLPYCRQVSC